MAEEIDFVKYKEHGAYHWQNYFGRVFKVNSFLRARYDIVIQLLREGGIKKDSELLEVGCGDGALSALIYKRFSCNLVGLEPSEVGVDFCKQMFAEYKYSGTFKVSKGYSFDYPENHFDYVVLADVIEHLQQPDLMLAEIKRVLKPGGHVVITTPIRISENPEDPMHVQEFFSSELRQLCDKFFGVPVKARYTHPVVWRELYTHGNKKIRSLIRFYCRVMDKIFGTNVFLKAEDNSKWKNFSMQSLLYTKN
jgi:ubiquinone/menaquinone biosynthesis C-methylase UbiE